MQNALLQNKNLNNMKSHLFKSDYVNRSHQNILEATQ